MSSAESISNEALASLSEKIIGERNERGIPSTVFIEDVAKFLSEIGISAIEPLIGAEQQLYSKYKFMEANLSKSRENFKMRIPETEKDLEMLKHLMRRTDEEQSVTTRFSLADNVFAKAKIDPSCNSVCIWLGANVMVEYSFDEAKTLLEKNFDHAVQRLSTIEADLIFLRDNIITSEVNIARIFNYDVRRKREARDEKLAAGL